MSIRKKTGTNNIIELLYFIYKDQDNNFIKLTSRGKDVFALIITGKTRSHFIILEKI